MAFLGSPAFALPSLEALRAAGHEVALVVTQPDRPAGRGQRPRPPAVAAYAREQGLALWQTSSLKGVEAEHRLRSVGAEAMALAAFAALAELCQDPGLGLAKAIQIKAALELGKRLVSLHPGQRPRITQPSDVYHLLGAEMATLEQEHLRVLLLDRKNHVLGAPVLYRGSLVGTTVRLAEVFREAVRQNVAHIVLVHNHPSGDPTPSPEDVRVTRDAVRAGELLDIAVLDHIIIGRGETAYISLMADGLTFTTHEAATS